MAKKKRKMGPRGKYLDWITPEGLLKIEGWARDGLTDEQIAHNIGIRRETLYSWKKDHPNINNALKEGKEVVDRQVENAMLKNALGFEYEETKTIIEMVDGEKKQRVEKIKKYQPPNTTAQIFWLKNRKRTEWRDRHETEITGNLNVASIATEIDEYLNGDST